ncbi:MAG: diacylglycerol kinase family lipid kinase [Bacteroidia bacterium]|nr:diacylglycerol kinase family lipid kinase [Bacteroidia bacterium]
MLKYLLITNPASGKRKGVDILRQVQPILRSVDIELESIMTSHTRHAEDIIREVDLTKFKAICVVGGDGTYHEVINGLLTRKDGIELPLGFIPAGTGNSLLKSLALDTVEAATKNILKGNIQTCDIAEIDTQTGKVYSFNVIGWGIPTDVNTMAEQFRWAKTQRYNLAAIMAIFRNRSRIAHVEMDDQIVHGDISFIVACNTAYAGNGMQLAPDAQIDDGLLDLLVIKKVSRFKLFRLFTKIFSGTHLPNNDIQYFRVKHFKVQSDADIPLIIDGETLGSAPFSVKVLPNRIKIFR